MRNIIFVKVDVNENELAAFKAVFAAIIRVVTQSGERHFMTILMTAAKEATFTTNSALQAATILVAMASEKKFWRPKFSRKSPIGDQQIKREAYLKNYQ